MSAVNVNALYPIFTDIDGQPLEDGYVWIGVSGLEPQANPQTAYWDAALTQVATQPVRTRGGYPLNGAAIGRLFTGAPYSIKVQNKRTSTIALELSGAAGTGVGSISFGTTGLTPAVATDGDVVVAGTLAVANGGTGVTTSTGSGSVVLSNSPSVLSPTVSSGNLSFSGTAQRITGDMTNATFSNRLAFQTSITNGATVVPAIPNGTGSITRLQAFNGSDPNNASLCDIGITSTAGEIRCNQSGTGTYLPMTFYTGGSERVRVDTSGNVGIGTASPSSYGRLGVMTPTANNGFFGIANSAGGAGGVQMAQYYSTVKISYIDTTLTNGTPGSETAYLAFATINSGTLAERMRITSTGNIVAGASAALATTATDGFLYVPTCAGTPTGTPTAITGMAPIVVNTTNNKLYFYSGGAWRDAGP